MMCEQEVRRNCASTGPGPIGVMHLLHHVPAATSILRRVRRRAGLLTGSDDELGLLSSLSGGAAECARAPASRADALDRSAVWALL